ncbi:MAG: MFS transporter [Planctomycetes bacterium]|nr:MFS transporter [Planctomycetota bacterium]
MDDTAPARAERLPTAARRRGLTVSIVEGLASQAHSALTGLGVGGNAITFGFALMLGASDVALGLLAAIPPLASAMQLVSAAVAPRLRERRAAVVVSSAAARLLWPACAALPFLLGYGDAALAAFLCLFALSCGLLSFSGNLWVSWMADLVPGPLRAGFFSLRNNLCAITGIAVALGAGYTLDRWFGGVPRGGVADAAAQALRAQGFALLFCVAAVAGLACALLLRAQPEPARPAQARLPLTLREAVVAPFADAVRRPGLRGFLLFVGVFGFTNGFAAPFWTPFQLEQLRLPYTTVNGTFVILQGAAMAVALPLWGLAARRLGNRIVVLAGVLLITTHPLYYLVATPERTWPIYLDALSSGVSWSGYNFAIFNLALGLSVGPRPERAFAVYATTAGLAQALSSAASGVIVDALPQVVDLGPWALDRRQVVFLACSVSRAGCVALFLWAVPAERGVGVRTVLAKIPYAVKAMTTQFRVLPRGR